MGEREQGEFWIFGASHVNDEDPSIRTSANPADSAGAIEQAPVGDPSGSPAGPAETPARPVWEGATEWQTAPAEPPPSEETPSPPPPAWASTVGADQEAPPSSLPGPSSSGSRRVPILVAAGLALVLATAGTTVALLRQGDNGEVQAAVAERSAAASLQPAASASTSPASTGAVGASDGDATTSSNPTDEPVGSPSPSPSASHSDSPSQQAKAQLEKLADEGLSSVSLEGQHVAMVASKWNGVRDPLQKTADGNHVFHYADILAEHDRLQAEDNFGADLVLLRSTDYGKRRKSPNGKVMYVTFAVGSFGSKEEVEDWCRERFANLSESERANNCVPTRLTD